nr:putative Ig domain-containing protein [Mucilaginibacter sp. X4EP1]MCS3814661.1 sugar lactone lactonase YvrE [Mucilaginibacter sp. X4EP1]
MFSASWSFAQSVITYGTSTLTYNVGTTIAAKFPTVTGGIPAAAYGQTTTFAGTGVAGQTNGAIASATFNHPAGVMTDASGNVIVSDGYNGAIRKITPAGVASTFFNTVNFPQHLAIDASGNIYLPEYNGFVIDKISPAGVLSKVAGILNTAGYIDGPVATAELNHPTAEAVDAAGNIYVTDYYNSCVRKITPSGTVSTFAGTNSQGLVNGTGTAARFSELNGLAFDKLGNLYIADKANNVIRMITPAGVVSTFAGNGTAGFVNGNASSASFNYPVDVAVDAASNIYVVDQNNNAIRKISPAGVVSTFAGSGSAGSTDGVSTAASFNAPYALSIDKSGNIYVADLGNNKIRKIIMFTYTVSPALPAGLALDPSTGAISGTPTTVTAAQNYTITANTNNGSCSTTISIGVNAALQTTSTGTNNATIASWTGKVSSDWNTAGNWSTSAVPGSVTNVQIGISPFTNQPTVNNNQQINNLTFGGRNPVTLTVNSGSTLTVSGQVVQNHASDDSTPTTTIVGAGTLSAASVQVGDLTNPKLVLTKTTTMTSQIANFNITGNLTINSTTANLLTGGIANNNVKFSLQAGTVNVGGQLAITNQIPAGCNNFGTAANTPNSLFSIDITPTQIARLFLQDSTHIAIANKAYGTTNFYPAVITYAGNGQAGIKDGPLATAEFSYPSQMVTDKNGNIYLIDNNGIGENPDYNGTMIREISTTGVVSTIAGSTAWGYVDGVGTAAKFSLALGLTIDASGNIYVADEGNAVIRKITPAGVVSTFAGNGTQGHADGQGTSAMFNFPDDITIDPSGNLYVADDAYVRKITPGGLVSTVAGNGTVGYVDGPANTAELAVGFITVDQSGNIYACNNNDNIIRKISNGVVSTFVTGSTESATGQITGPIGEVQGLKTDAAGNIYVCDAGYDVVDKITPAGVITDLTFSDGLVYHVGRRFNYTNNMPLSVAQFDGNGITLDAAGNIYLTDFDHNVIREIIFSKKN